MALPVKLNDIIEGMGMGSDQSSSYLNKKTGEVSLVTDEDISYQEYEEDELFKLPTWQQKAVEEARVILGSDDYIQLPTKFDIHEYRIMKEFCLSLHDAKLRGEMLDAIASAGAFRRFKNRIHKYNIENDWFKYRHEAFTKIAIEWCEDNNIPYIQ